jgi:hypothetical protein
MNVAAILSAKGNTVEVVGPNTGDRGRAPHGDARHRLAGRPAPTINLIGVVGERDVVRAIDHHGPRLEELRVRDIVNQSVATCAVNDDLSEVMRRMTATRSRHMPVLEAPGRRPDQHRRRRQAPPQRARARDPRPPRRLPLTQLTRSGRFRQLSVWRRHPRRDTESWERPSRGPVA